MNSPALRGSPSPRPVTPTSTPTRSIPVPIQPGFSPPETNEDRPSKAVAQSEEPSAPSGPASLYAMFLSSSAASNGTDHHELEHIDEEMHSSPTASLSSNSPLNANHGFERVLDALTKAVENLGTRMDRISDNLAAKLTVLESRMTVVEDNVRQVRFSFFHRGAFELTCRRIQINQVVFAPPSPSLTTQSHSVQQQHQAYRSPITNVSTSNGHAHHAVASPSNNSIFSSGSSFDGMSPLASGRSQPTSAYTTAAGPSSIRTQSPASPSMSSAFSSSSSHASQPHQQQGPVSWTSASSPIPPQSVNDLSTAAALHAYRVSSLLSNSKPASSRVAWESPRTPTSMDHHNRVLSLLSSFTSFSHVLTTSRPAWKHARLY